MLDLIELVLNLKDIWTSQIALNPVDEVSQSL